MRLIDADEIMKALSIFNDIENGNSHFLNGIETAKELIEDAPIMAEIDETEKAILRMFRKKMFVAACDATIYDPVAWSLYQVWKWFDEHRKGRRNDGH